MDTQTIIGFLGGSLATILIKQIFDHFNRKTEFKREIHKITYIKKLELSEKAVSYYYTYNSAVNQIRQSVEKISSSFSNLDNSEDGLDTIQKIIDTNSIALKVLGESQEINVNGINLYFDLDDNNDWGDAESAQLLDNCAKLEYQNDYILLWTKKYNEFINENDDKMANFCISEIKKISPEYIQNLKNYSYLLSKNFIAVKNRINKIKMQIK